MPNINERFAMEKEAKNAENLPQEKEDPILDHAIYYAINGAYPSNLNKEKKRAVRKRASTLILESGEVYLQRKDRRVKVIQSRKDQLLIIKACHSEPTSGHFGVTKTWRRVAEQFYWKGMVADVHEHVSV